MKLPETGLLLSLNWKSVEELLILNQAAGADQQGRVEGSRSAETLPDSNTVARRSSISTGYFAPGSRSTLAWTGNMANEIIASLLRMGFSGDVASRSNPFVI